MLWTTALPLAETVWETDRNSKQTLFAWVCLKWGTIFAIQKGVCLFVCFGGRDPFQPKKRGPVWDDDFAWGVTVSFPRLIYCKNYISLIEVKNQHFEKLHSESKIFRNENQDPFLLSQVKSQYILIFLQPKEFISSLHCGRWSISRQSSAKSSHSVHKYVIH